jgi:hypothetical protein
VWEVSREGGQSDLAIFDAPHEMHRTKDYFPDFRLVICGEIAIVQNMACSLLSSLSDLVPVSFRSVQNQIDVLSTHTGPLQLDFYRISATAFLQEYLIQRSPFLIGISHSGSTISQIVATTVAQPCLHLCISTMHPTSTISSQASGDGTFCMTCI